MCLAALVDSTTELRVKMEKRCAILTFIIITVIVVAVIIGLSIGLTRKSDSDAAPPTPQPILPPPTAPLGADGPYREQVVAADAGKCSEIGRDILKKKGSAVDAAVATLFCVGVINMHSAGVGGGGFMIVYSRSTKTADLFDFREEAPGRANTTMYVNGTLSSRVGGSAVGVPGEVRGFHAAWKKYGKLSWKELVQPAIDLATEGFQLGKSAYYAFTRKSVQPLLKKDPGMRELLFEDGEPKKLGQVIKMPKFAKTLEKIRDDPEDFYTGQLAEDIAKEVRDGGGIITAEDLKNYMVKVKKPLSGEMFGYKWYSTPPPGSGAVLNLILNILKGYNMTTEDRNTTNSSVLTYHRIVEAFKYAYAYRALLADEDYSNITTILKEMTSTDFAESLRQKIRDDRTFTNVSHYGDFYFKEDGGTSHLSLLAPNGDAVSATTTVNLFFGARYRGMKTGIIYNNEMDDFSTPGLVNAFGVEPSETNFIVPGKRPMSSTCPSVFVDNKGDVRLVIGASGGTKITSATSLAIMNYLWFNKNLSAAVTEPRLHHQLMPMYVRIDKDYPMPQDIQDGLRNLGHDVQTKSSFAVVQAVAKDKDGEIWGKSDPRKSAWAAGV